MLGYMRQLKDVAMNIWRLKHILVCTVEVLKFYYAIIKWEMKQHMRNEMQQKKKTSNKSNVIKSE